MKVEFKLDSNRALGLFDKFSVAASKAQNDATKRSTKALEKSIVNSTKQKVNLKVGKIKEIISTNIYKGTVTLSNKAPNLANFLSKSVLNKMQGRRMYSDPKNKGLKIKLFKDRAPILMEGTFLAYGRNDNLLVFKRKSGSQSKVRSLYGRWARDIWEIPRVQDRAFSESQSTFEKRFVSTFDHFNK